MIEKRNIIQPKIKSFRLLFAVFCLSIISILVCAQPSDRRDISSSWEIYSQGHYQSVNTNSLNGINTIYFDIDSKLFKNATLYINSDIKFTMWINGQLVSGGTSLRFNIDSLSRLYSNVMKFGIHSKTGLGSLSTTVDRINNTIATQKLSIRNPDFSKNYLIIASLVLIFFFLGIKNLNSQITLNYFSFFGCFFIKENKEKLLASSNSSGVIILYYIFGALLYGYLFSIIKYNIENSLDFSNREIQSFGDAIIQWGQLSVYFLEAFIVKLVIIFVFSSLFNLKDSVSFQFFNFLRLTLFIAFAIAALCLLVVVPNLQSEYFSHIVPFALFLLIVGTIMVPLKLLSWSNLSYFHLFSYICVSEIIPLIITIKIML